METKSKQRDYLQITPAGRLIQWDPDGCAYSLEETSRVQDSVTMKRVRCPAYDRQSDPEYLPNTCNAQTVSVSGPKHTKESLATIIRRSLNEPDPGIYPL